MSGAGSAWQAVGALAPLAWGAAFALCVGLIVLLRPALESFAVATANARSSHVSPTPQWGGLAVVGATLCVAACALALAQLLVLNAGAAPVLLAALFLMVLGVADDMMSLGAAAKMAAQAVAVALVLAALPADLRLLPVLPQPAETAVLFVGVLWFVNLVNFMDGIDWMLVAEVVPVTAGVALIGALAPLPPEALIVALALNGAMLGFAPFNRPVARLFMGDMGSLPTGLLVAWLLILVAGSGHLAAAILLPLYFIADSGLTLLRRMRAGERVWQAHRTHFYQRARDNGFTTREVVGRVFAVNLGLVALALLSVLFASAWAAPVLLGAGGCLVAWLMIGFAQVRP